MLREFILGSNRTGLVTNSSGAVSVVGGEVTSLEADVLPGQTGIYMGTGTTQSTYTFPSATIAAWDKFIESATSGPAPTPTGPSNNSQGDGQASEAVSIRLSWFLISLCTLPALFHRWA